MSSRNGMVKKFFATAAAGAVAVIGLAGAAAAAPVEGTTGAGEPAINSGDATGSLTITKYVGTESNQNNNGSDIDVPRTPLEGAEYEIVRVTTCGTTAMDLKEGAAWGIIKEKDAVIAAGGVLEECETAAVENGTGVTNADGQIVFKSLPMGLYYVKELSSGTTGVTTGHPFLVTIPYPSEQGQDGWTWDVKVYPKNHSEGPGEPGDPDPSGPSKSTEGLEEGSQDLSVGAQIPWTIKGSTMAGLKDASGQYVWDYRFVDQLDPRLIPDLEGIVVSNATTAFEKGTDYTVLCTDGSTEQGKENAGCKLQIVFTAEGLHKLNGTAQMPEWMFEDNEQTQAIDGLPLEKPTPAHKGMGLNDRVVIEFTTTLTEKVDGGLTNVANQYVDKPGTGPGEPTAPLPPDPTEPPEPGTCDPNEEGTECPPEKPKPPVTETPEPAVYFGAAELLKVNGNAENNPGLPGAKFKVVEGACSDFSTEPTSFVQRGDDDYEVTSGSDGKINFDTLYVGKVADVNASPLVLPDAKAYCLVETVAPNGFIRPSWPANGHTVMIKADETTATSWIDGEESGSEIVNTEITGPTLPLTGAAGTALLIVGGLALVGLAGSIVVTSRRRSAENA